MKAAPRDVMRNGGFRGGSTQPRGGPAQKISKSVLVGIASNGRVPHNIFVCAKEFLLTFAFTHKDLIPLQLLTDFIYSESTENIVLESRQHCDTPVENSDCYNPV